MIKSMIKRVATIALAGAMLIGSLSVNNLQVEAKEHNTGKLWYSSREDYWNIWDATGYTEGRPAEFWVGDFGYKKLSNNTAAVTLFMGYENTALNIPATVTYEGVTYTVTRIGREDESIYLGDTTFPNYHNSFTGLVIPSTVTEIGEGAFSGMNISGKITIPDTVTKLGKGAFAANETVNEIVIGSGITKIPKMCFSGNTNVTKVTIGKNVKTISEEAFAGCKLKNVVIKSKKLKKIGNNAFSCHKWVKKNEFTVSVGISRKITVKVPKSKLNEYKKLVTKSWKKTDAFTKDNKYTFKKM
ncbi:leucine-rich repeat domain-containing protein [Butyrivibrio sp. MB2005]|uniref:leucine-rich repeat domain-containing protein n=1 Tax=Butyrivibrio sp. MB2005 TaxID=1280678 RepID=UPI0003F8D5EB|nr:leucine-rich repeat domain-containing protein [Butyrivibrio sp. MB2005]